MNLYILVFEALLEKTEGKKIWFSRFLCVTDVCWYFGVKSSCRVRLFPHFISTSYLSVYMSRILYIILGTLLNKKGGEKSYM